MAQADVQWLLTAERYLDAGLNIIPPEQDGSKKPLGEWKAHQSRATTDQEMRRWYRNSGRTGIGVITGAISGNLEMLEFDWYDTYVAFGERAQEWGMGELVDRIRNGYSESTPGHGIHWYYRCEEIAGNTKLAQRPEPTTDNPLAVKVLIETRGEGGFSIMAPSCGTVHPSGRPYEVVSGRVEDIATISAEERRALWDLARSFNQMPERTVAPMPPSGSTAGDRPGDLYNARATWEETLTGWTAVYRRGVTTYWRRPGKDFGISASVNHSGNDTLMVFSTSTPFETVPTSYTRFAAYAVLAHGGDFRAAGKALWQEGYRGEKAALASPVTQGAAKVEKVDPETGEIVPRLDRVLLDDLIKRGVPEVEWVIDDVLVRGMVHLCYGEPESGKTIIGTGWMKDAIKEGKTVLFVDEESGAASISKFFAAMGVERVDHGLHYFPFPSLEMEDAAALLAYVDEIQPDLVVFDSLTDMLTQAGLDENSGVEVTRWMLDVAQAIARRPWAPAVVLIDHITKDAGNVKYSVASRAKKAKSDVLWLVEKQGEFDPTKTAQVVLQRYKNRPGVLPKSVRYTVGGKDGMLIAERFDVARHGARALSAGAEKCLLSIANGNHRRDAVAADMGVTPEEARLRFRELEEAGLAHAEGQTTRRLWSLTSAGLSNVAKFFEDVAKPLDGPNLATEETALSGPVAKLPSGEKAPERYWYEDKLDE